MVVFILFYISCGKMVMVNMWRMFKTVVISLPRSKDLHPWSITLRYIQYTCLQTDLPGYQQNSTTFNYRKFIRSKILMKKNLKLIKVKKKYPNLYFYYLTSLNILLYFYFYFFNNFVVIVYFKDRKVWVFFYYYYLSFMLNNVCYACYCESFMTFHAYYINSKHNDIYLLWGMFNQVLL